MLSALLCGVLDIFFEASAGHWNRDSDYCGQGQQFALRQVLPWGLGVRARMIVGEVQDSICCQLRSDARLCQVSLCGRHCRRSAHLLLLVV